MVNGNKQEKRPVQAIPGGCEDALATAHEARDNLLFQNRFLESLLEAIPSPVFYKDASGVYLGCNRAFEEYKGLARDQIIGKTLFDISPEELADAFKETDDRLLADSGTETHETRLGYADGSLRDVFITKATFGNGNGHIGGIIGVIIDITERKKAEEKLVDTFAALEEREARLRGITEAAKDAILLIDGDGRIVHWNPAAVKIFGYEASEATGMQVKSLMPKESREQVFREFEEYVLSDDVSGSTPFEYEGVRKNGTRFAAEVSISAFKLKGQRFVEAAIRDISDRKRAEESLRESEERMRTILDASPFGMILVDEDHRIVDINPAAAKLTGYERDELVGKICHDFVCPGEEGTCPIYDFGLEMSNRETILLNRYGESIPVLKTAVLINVSGRSVVLEMVADITEQKRTEEALQHINAELDGFAHTVSHDLKGPLAAIMSASETLKVLLAMPPSDENKADVFEMADVIAEGASRSTALINDVLALASAGQQPKEVSLVDLGEVVERVVAERSAVIAEKNIRVERGDNLGTVVANPTHVYQLFTNLIGNAIKHNDSERPAISIAYLGEDRTRGRRYLVRDNGSGIPPGNLKKIFIPFFKGETGETGIGLSTVEKIVQIYGGKIRAYNDGGACFEFVLRDYEGA